MRYRLCLTFLVALAGWAAGPAAAANYDLDRARDDYEDAVSALRGGRNREFQQLRDQLDQYPLSIYLDYFNLSRQPSAIRPVEARQFVRDSEGSPLGNRLLAAYLERAGRERRWRDFLALMPQEPNSVELKCYYFRARLADGDPLAAWEGAERLWVHGESRPKACDPLFSAWIKAGELDDDIVWARMLKAFDARQRSLLRYVGSKGSDRLAPWADKLQRVYASPAVLPRLTLPPDQPRSRDIVSHGLAYLARYKPERALHHWRQYQNDMAFSPEQREQVEAAIVLHSLFAESAANRAWVDTALPRLKQDRLVEIRLRWALAERDWQSMAALLPVLSPGAREANVWRYWQAHVQEVHGEVEAARAALAELATERDYYGFLAADRLGRPYAFNAKPIVLANDRRDALLQLPPVRRVGELNFHRETNNAHSEWYQLLKRSENGQQEALASLAASQGWYRMAIDAANRARAWDALDLRFPLPYQDTFTRYASLHQVPSTELMAIARRESAFYPRARSPVGARGLMQIMPATGRQVASALGEPHDTGALYDVEHNVLLGSAYYRQLLDRFDGNRVFALTAYNAGPHRVDRWRHKPGETVPAEVWIETIPYRETRNYVQAVLAYNVVFRHLRGEPHGSVLNPVERAASY
ncbi:transglycosylase SLT domain-containing protein [Parahaliea mediterranea]|uniref:Transglycosylase SLT domain-containing protein n=1 Tax=Parahaliea mediterranea TaxID=651086 RepID=A0A939DGW6_9GAMM|nr:transglycosylase SLT domain-containing protein [Parahaliea mediterranea]MBN7797961.1 transglycosylase SLT domain-containing protein [Parahaliea mediterranea]